MTLIRIETEASRLDRQHCVYTLAFNGQTVFAAACKLSDLTRLDAVRSNDAAAPILQSSERIAIDVVSFHNDRIDAETALSIMLAATPLHCNTIGKPVTPSKVKGAIRCIQTGEVYRNSAEAARCNGIAKSVLSEHLNGRYTTAGGKRFERVTQ